MRDAVLVVSFDCRLHDRARSLLLRLGFPFREIDLAGEETAEPVRNGVPAVLFSVPLDGDRRVAFGDIREAGARRALAIGTAG